MAFRCLANDPYVTDGVWFSLSKKVRRLKRRRARATIYVSKTARLAMKGKVRLRWETRRTVRSKKTGKRRRMWKRIHGGLRSVSIKPTGKRKRLRVTQRLKYKGRWRLRVTYLGKAPYRNSRARSVYFTVK